jgi:hypothetical protein
MAKRVNIIQLPIYSIPWWQEMCAPSIASPTTVGMWGMIPHMNIKCYKLGINQTGVASLYFLTGEALPAAFGMWIVIILTLTDIQ